MTNICESISELVGNTPLVKLSRLAKKHKLKADILGKCEFFNPAFSVKDRVALSMINKIPLSKITKETIFLEATSGNTGIGLAAVCASKGYKLIIIMPENMSAERIAMIKHYGAEVILTPKEDGMDGAVKKAQMLSAKNPNVIYLKQFENPANVEAHSFGTAIELMRDTEGQIDALVAGVGTSGTISGIAKTLKSCNPDLYVVAVEPAESPVLRGEKAGAHGIQGIGANFVPNFYDPALVDEIMDIKTDEAVLTAKETAALEGLAVGISSGAAIAAALKLGANPKMAHKNIVVILPDSIERYLSLSYFK